MTLQSAIDDELPFLRAEAEARMTSRAAVMRKTGLTTVVDGLEVTEWATVHADLPFRTGMAGTRGHGGVRGATIGGITFEDASGVGHFPAATTDLLDNDMIEVWSGEWSGDVFRVIAAVRYDQRTARRLPIIEAPRPEEWT